MINWLPIFEFKLFWVIKGKSLTLYALITLLDSFLIMSVFYTYGLLAPVHILIYWLSFNRILSSKHFKSSWNENIFALIPLVFQIAFFFIIFISQERVINIRDALYAFQSPPTLILLIITIVEFFILKSIYLKYKKREAYTSSGTS